jgi:hypothetical protein
MHKEARTLITAASGALCLASLFLHLWLFDKYFNSLPHQPQPQFGRVRPLNNHGSYVYLTDAEATGLSFLTLAFFVGFLVTKQAISKRTSDDFGVSGFGMLKKAANDRRTALEAEESAIH